MTDSLNQDQIIVVPYCLKESLYYLIILTLYFIKIPIMDVILLYKLIWFGTVPGKYRRYLHNTRISLFLYCLFADQVIELPNLYSEAEATTLFASTFSTIQFLRIVLYFQ